MHALLAVLLSLQEDPLRLEGAPFLVFGETVEVRAVTSLKDVSVAWRVADAPGGILSSLETKPPFDSRTFTVRGPDRLELRSTGKTEGDILLSVTLERRGTRVASAEYRLRVGPVLRVRAWCRVVEHPKGGTARPELVRESGARASLEAEVNARLRPLGLEVSLEAGRPVAAPDGWFDRDGRFHPVVLKDGKKANSPSLDALLRHNEPGGLNFYLVRDCHWTTVEPGFRRVVTEHSLRGIGLKDGVVVLDDSADALSLAHEFGHAFSLDDLGEERDRGRMMFSVRRQQTGTLFDHREMKDARESARRHLKSFGAR